MSDHVALSVDQLAYSGKCTGTAAGGYTETARSSSPRAMETSAFLRAGSGREACGVPETACTSDSEMFYSREGGVIGMACSAEMGRADMASRMSDMACDREVQGQEMENVYIERGEGDTRMSCFKGVESELETPITANIVDEEAIPLLKSKDADVDGGQVVIAIKSGPDCSKKAIDSPAFAECRICQEEDDIANLESPCACSGSLKFAHRTCVQHWCNEKGDTLCEICQKPFESGYAIPHQASADSIPVNIGAGWDIASGQPRFFALPADHHFLEGDYDEYAGSHAHSAACFRSVALILVALLLLRHIFSMTGVGEDEDLSTFFLLSLVRAAGFLIPCYIMARAMNALQMRRQRQEAAMAAAAEVTHLFQAGRIQGVATAEP